jgi:transcription elongation factor GreB
VILDIVPTSQLRVANGDITEASPIGSALIKARVGDVVRVVLPAGVRSLEVLAVDSPAE